MPAALADRPSRRYSRVATAVRGTGEFVERNCEPPSIGGYGCPVSREPTPGAENRSKTRKERGDTLVASVPTSKNPASWYSTDQAETPKIVELPGSRVE